MMMLVRADLPSGTVTFLFTDVEGSTRLLHELGSEGYAEALAEHRRVIREACAAEGGVEVDTHGDAFFFAFPTAPGAIAAAEAMTTALAQGSIQVRIGLHTGTPLVSQEGYVGGDVHRAARIAAVGHGGQVLVSSSTAPLVEVELTDLGEHRLKDLSAPERMYQLGEVEFPALNSLYRTNLPIPSTPFVGREAELAEVAALLASSDTRLLTLTGPGGTGKTRLALEAAAQLVDEYPHGSWWVELQSIQDPALVPSAIANAIDTRGDAAASIRDKRMLILLDNFEHLVEAATDAGALLTACPNLMLLATSREPLHLAGEREYHVGPMQEADAVALFRERAYRDGNEEAALAICRRVDCLPLAVELAAGRTNALAVDEVLERLEQRLPLLTGGPRDAPARQQTLRATIEWSHELLDRKHQQLFARLAVFVGGCTLEAAEDVCEADLDRLQALVGSSLLASDDGRYTMLETIREYASERLQAQAEAESIREAHAHWYLELARQIGAGLPAHEYAGVEFTQRWLPRVEADLGNLRAALAWLIAHDEKEEAFQLIRGLQILWSRGGHFDTELLRWFGQAFGTAGAVTQPTMMTALRNWGEVFMFLKRLSEAEPLLEEALLIARALGDDREMVMALRSLGMTAQRANDLDRARRLLQEAVAIPLDDPLPTTLALGHLGEVELDAGNIAQARALAEEALTNAQRIGHPKLVAFVGSDLAEVDLEAGSLDSAELRFREALELGSSITHVRFIWACLAGLAAVAAERGRLERAGRLWAGLLRNLEEEGADVAAAIHPRYRRRLERRTDSEFRRGLIAGQTLNLDELVAYALGESA